MKRSHLAAGCLLLLASCAGPGPEAPLTGYWLEVMPVNRQFVQGVHLAADGTASSIGMHTLKYTGWLRQDDRLILRGQSLGNGQTLAFSDTLDIVRLDADTLTLEKFGRYRIEYVRTDFRAADGSSLLDSMQRPLPTSVLDIRTFRGAVPSSSGELPCAVTLYNYDNCGDGVFLLVKGEDPASAASSAGRMFTLRGDASDRDAVVYELRPFDGSASLYFRFLGDRLETLDAALFPVASDGTYALTLR